MPGDSTGVSVDELAARFPQLWHMAEAGSWPSIERNGLLSTSALLDLFEIRGAQRAAIENQRRPDSVTIRHPDRGVAVIRDNKPMLEKVLQRTLVGYTPQEWYRLLNGKVFFWLREERLHRLRQAGAYRDRKHLIITVDTRALLLQHGDRVTLSGINSGATHPGAKYPRGRETFMPLSQFPWTERNHTHKKEPVVELSVEYSVPDVATILRRRREL